MYTCKTGNLTICLFLIVVLLYIVCTQVKPDILTMRLCVYVCVVVEGMYKCKNGNFGSDTLCLCFCCCRGYVHKKDCTFCQQAYAFMFLLL